MEPAAASGISQLPHNSSELKEVSSYVANYEKQMRNLSVNFNDKNYLQLMWDSKVPEDDQRWYYFFNLSASDRGEVVAGIKKYENFYREMDETIRKVRQSEEEGSEMKTSLLISNLNSTLKKMYQAAKGGERSCSSSTLYNLHRSFQRQHAELEHAIKRVECVALNNSVKKAKGACEKANSEVGTLQIRVNEVTRENKEISKKLDNLTIENKNMKKTMDEVLESNQKMTQQIESLLAYIRETQNN